MNRDHDIKDIRPSQRDDININETIRNNSN